MLWFRFYHEALDDPKVQQLPPALFRHWVNVLCLANMSEPRGTLPDLDAVAFKLRLSASKARAVLADLETAGLVDRDNDGRYRPHNWNGRQRQSDDVAERVKKHRAQAAGNGSVTLQETPQKLSRATETETETETDAEENAPLPPGRAGETDEPADPIDISARRAPKPAADPPGFERFWAAWPSGHRAERKQAVEQWRRLKPDAALQGEILAAVEAQKRGRKWLDGYVKAPHRWLRDRNWTDEVEPPVLAVANGRPSATDPPIRGGGLSPRELIALSHRYEEQGL